jgi:glycine/D-amino acid oxidase-like deaminating enzyme
MLLEGGRLASGATAAGLGAILPQPDATFRAVEAAAGLRAARAAWKTARRSALEFASVLRKLDVKCDLTPAALVINARTTGRAAELRREQASRKAAGLDAPWLAGAATTAEIGTESAGALRLREGFTFDPVRAALGLAAAAQASDAQIFERSVVRRTRFTRRYADVVLASGTIRTRQVVVATGTPGALFDQLRRHVREHFGYAVVTESLSARMRRETGRRAGVLTEVADSAPWLRWLPDDRALFAGGRSAPVGWQQLEKAVIRRAADLMYELSVRYPVISGLPARWAWRLPIVSTADGLPWIGPHRNYPFHFFALAFGWHGDGLVWHAARAALRAFHGETTPDDRAFHFVR